MKKSHNRPSGLLALLLLLALPAVAEAQFSYTTTNGVYPYSVLDGADTLDANDAIIIGGYSPYDLGDTVIVIPNEIEGLPVTGIRQSAFYFEPIWTSATIGNNMTNIGPWAFGDCYGLTTVYFLGNAPSLDATVFHGDNNVTLYYLPGASGYGSSLQGHPTVLLAPPAIALQPQGQALNPGENATLTVAADSVAPLSYQWLLNGALIGGATSSSCAVVAPPESGSYSVVVSNFAGSVTSAAAVLTVQVPSLTTVTIASGLTANDKIYDGASTATLSSNNVVLAGVLPGDVGNVALSTNGYTAAFASAGLGTNISVAVSGLEPDRQRRRQLLADPARSDGQHHPFHLHPR